MAFLGFTFIIFSIPSIFYKGEYSKNLNSFTGTHFANFKNCCSWTFVHYNSLFDNFLLFFNGIALFIVLTHLKYGSTPSRENLCPFLSPRCQNPVFYLVVWVFKKYIFSSLAFEKMKFLHWAAMVRISSPKCIKFDGTKEIRKFWCASVHVWGL